MVSDNDGSSWESYREGLPDNVKPVRLYTGKDYMYLTTWDSGIYTFDKKSSSWKEINSTDFRKRSIYYKNAGFRKISAFAVDSMNSKNIVTATKHSIYQSLDAGKLWKKIPMRGLNKRNYITALAVKGKKIYAGTSFNGIYELIGSRFRHSGKNLPGEPYSGTLRFTEQVSNILTSKKDVYASFYFGGGIYSKKEGSKKFIPKINGEKRNISKTIYDLVIYRDRIYYSLKNKVYRLDPEMGSVELKRYNQIISSVNRDKDTVSMTIVDKAGKNPSIAVSMQKIKEVHNKKASKKNAIYVSVPALRKNLNKYISLTKTTTIDSFVIDMKDDFGNIYFSSKNKIVREIHSQRKPVKIESILKQLKKNKIYAIARIVVFKDKKMFSAYNGKYAIKNKKNGKPWRGTNREYWVDPHSKFVHNYNIALAVELEKLGFDEIQFDYIRFPSDGPIGLCNFTYREDPETYKSEILIDFLKQGKEILNIPVSVDIYGFNSWYHFGNWIGQDMEEFSHVVNAVCPMVYPSHFGKSFYKKGKRAERPYRIVYDGGKRAMALVNTAIVIRPYLQAFNLLAPTWGPEYVKYQIDAASESGCSGYTLWNARGDYKVPKKALSIN